MSFILEKILTDHARRVDKQYTVYRAKRVDGTDENYVLFKGKTPIYDTKEFEAMAVKIDILQRLEDEQ